MCADDGLLFFSGCHQIPIQYKRAGNDLTDESSTVSLIFTDLHALSCTFTDTIRKVSIKYTDFHSIPIFRIFFDDLGRDLDTAMLAGVFKGGRRVNDPSVYVLYEFTWAEWWRVMRVVSEEKVVVLRFCILFYKNNCNF